MKKALVVFLVLAFLAGNKSNAQNDNAGAYMSALAQVQNEMNHKYMAYVSAVAHGRRARKVEKMRLQVIESINNARYKTIEVGNFKGDNSLKQSSIDYIKLCYNIFNDDYGKIVNMEEIAEQSFDEMQAYILLQEKTDEKLKEAGDAIEKATAEFAAKYNVTLVNESSELGNKMEEAASLQKYSNQLYLIFFKVNWQDAMLLRAMEAKKLNEIEQTRNAMISYINEGLAILDTMKAYNSDATLVEGCRKSLLTYLEVAEKIMPSLVDHILKQEDFQKQQKAMKSKSKPSKEEIDAYNQAVNDINASVKTFNQDISLLNKTREAAYEHWEKAQKKFYDKNMPHYK